jgi:drug/metabolite transporter (DMT)-like permease
LLIAAAGIWGATFPVVKGALVDADPWTFLALRFGLAAALLVPLLRSRGSYGPGAGRAAACGVALFVGYVLQTWGLASTTPARSAFITALSVVLVPLLEGLLGLSRPTVRVWGGAGLALLGLAVLLRPEAQPISLGDVLTAGCAVAFAFHVLLLQWAVQAMPPARASAVQVLTTAALAIPAAAWQGQRLLVTPRLAGAVLICAVLATVFAFWAMTAVQRVLTAAVTAVVLAFEPVAAALVSLALGEDRPSWSLLAGGAVVVAGVLLATVDRRTAPTVVPADREAQS